MTSTASLHIALTLTALLALMHALAPRLRKQGFVAERVISSFSGGFAVAFVFLHLLPGLIEQRDTVGEILAESFEMTPVFDLAVFFVALLGFNAVLILEQRARRGTARGGNQASFFYVHLAFFGLYNGLITYTMPVRIEASTSFAVVFTLAMGLHFVINDRTMELHHPRLFARSGRAMLIGALFVGWTLAWLTEPDSLLLVALLSSFLGGSVLMNVSKEEVPSDRESSMPAFLCGEAAGAIVLLVVTLLE